MMNFSDFIMETLNIFTRIRQMLGGVQVVDELSLWDIITIFFSISCANQIIKYLMGAMEK